MFLIPAIVAATLLSNVRSAHAEFVNPSFSIASSTARVALADAAASPVRLQRPLVILGGFLDVGVGPFIYERALRRCVQGPIVRITFFDCLSLEQCRRRVAERLDAEFGVVDDMQTIDVDVIGQSLGGLIAMHAALDDPSLGKRLQIKRLFTISSPLRGAKLATRTSWDVFAIQRDTRPGNALARRLATTPLAYELFSYTRLDDHTVGEAYASLAGHGVYWVDTPRFESAHAGAFGDPRLLLDIVRRLRGETPVAHDPPAPLPNGRITWHDAPPSHE